MPEPCLALPAFVLEPFLALLPRLRPDMVPRPIIAPEPCQALVPFAHPALVPQSLLVPVTCPALRLTSKNLILLVTPRALLAGMPEVELPLGLHLPVHTHAPDLSTSRS